MKNKYLKIAGLLLLLAWSSCEKVEIPDSVYTGIPFGIRGMAGNEDLQLGIDQAGTKLITMAEFVEDSVWEFSGKLESAGSDGRFLSIQLRNRQEGRDSNIQWQPFIYDTLGFMQEGGIMRLFYPLRIKAENTEGLKIFWVQAGDQRREISQQEAIFLIPNKEKLPVCIEYGDSMVLGKFCSEISPQPMVQTTFPNWLIMSGNQQTARLVARLNNGLPVKYYNWGNGDQNSEHFSADSAGVYEIQMTDVQNRRFSHRKQLLFNNTNGYETYGNSFNFMSEWLPPTVLTDKKQLRSVNISYKDRAGVIYRSNRGPQSVSKFIIEEIREYEKDGRGRPTLAMKVRFDAILFSQTGESIHMNNCHGWFAVGLP